MTSILLPRMLSKHSTVHKRVTRILPAFPIHHCSLTIPTLRPPIPTPRQAITMCVSRTRPELHGRCGSIAAGRCCTALSLRPPGLTCDRSIPLTSGILPPAKQLCALVNPHPQVSGRKLSHVLNSATSACKVPRLTPKGEIKACWWRQMDGKNPEKVWNFSRLELLCGKKAGAVLMLSICHVWGFLEFCRFCS